MTNNSVNNEDDGNSMVCTIDGQSKEDGENTHIAQMYAYDSLRGSANASPKSCDSQSSLEDRVTSAIRRLPIPSLIKCNHNMISQTPQAACDCIKRNDGYVMEQEDSKDSEDSNGDAFVKGNISKMKG